MRLLKHLWQIIVAIDCVIYAWIALSHRSLAQHEAAVGLVALAYLAWAVGRDSG